MSCLSDGFDWVCAKDETIHVSGIDNRSKGPLATLLASLDYYPEKTEEKPNMPDQSTVVEESRDSYGNDESRGFEEGEALHKEELALTEEILEEEEDCPIFRSPQFVRHVDEKVKAQSRAKELEQIRQLNLASQNVVKIDSFEAPTDRDTFQKRQKELVDELRRNQRAAKEIMHSYRADDKHLLSEIRKASLKETNTPGRLLNAPTTPAYFTMAEIDQLQRLRKEIAAWRNERHRSFEDGHIVEPESEEQELASLDEESWFDIKTVRTIFDRRKSVDEALKSPLPESPRSLVPGKEGEDTDHTVSNTENAVYCLSTEEDRFVVSTAAKDELSDPNCVNFQVQKSEDVEENSDIESSESLGRRVDVEEAVTMESENPYEDSIRSESKEAHADDPSEDDIRSTSERFLQSEVTRRSKVVPRLLENDDSYASVKTPTNSRSIRPISVSTTAKTRISMSSRTLSPQGKRLFHASQQNNGSTRRTKDANLVQDENEDPPSSPNTTTDQLAKNVVLKRVPLYCRRPTIGPKKETSAVCQGRYIPNLHVQRDGCERCLYWASAKEKEKFFERGHHLRIMMVRGGCGRNCTIFPRKADEFPVRLCKKCYFDTHRSSGLSNDGEEQLLWNQAASP